VSAFAADVLLLAVNGRRKRALIERFLTDRALIGGHTASMWKNASEKWLVRSHRNPRVLLIK
jgi:hypothetical protein